MITLFLFGAGVLLFVGGVIASLRDRKFAWRAFLGGLALIGAAFGLGWLLPRLLYPP